MGGESGVRETQNAKTKHKCWPLFGQTWPQDLARSTGFVRQCRLHQKSTPPTNSKAISWLCLCCQTPDSLLKSGQQEYSKARISSDSTARERFSIYNGGQAPRTHHIRSQPLPRTKGLTSLVAPILRSKGALLNFGETSKWHRCARNLQ